MAVKLSVLGLGGGGGGALTAFLTSIQNSALLVDPGVLFSSGGAIATDATNFQYDDPNNILRVTSGLQLSSTGFMQWSSGAIGAASDLFLKRTSANRLKQENGANAQRFDIFNSLSGADEEFGSLTWSANTFFISTTFGGAGVGRNLQIGPVGANLLVFQSGGTGRWNIAVGGDLTAVTDNTYNIGAVGASRPATIFAGTAVRSPLYIAGATNGFTGTVTPVTTITMIGGIVTACA